MSIFEEEYKFVSSTEWCEYTLRTNTGECHHCKSLHAIVQLYKFNVRQPHKNRRKIYFSVIKKKQSQDILLIYMIYTIKKTKLFVQLNGLSKHKNIIIIV